MKYLSYEGLAHLKLLIKNALSGKVDVETGKGLSTNDFTNELKNKYDNVATKVDELTSTGGEPNIIETVKVNGTIQTIADKTVDITVPTKISELTNDDDTVKDASYVHTDNNYTTNEKNKLAGLENYDDTEIKAQIAQAGKIDIITVNGTAQEVTNKTVALTIPTDNAQLANGAGYLTAVPSEYITETELASAISGKADTSAIPTNNNQLTNGAGYQTAADVNAIVEAVVGAAPEALNTLDELAAALGDDANFAATVTSELAKKANASEIVAITNSEIDTIWES